MSTIALLKSESVHCGERRETTFWNPRAQFFEAKSTALATKYLHCIE